MRLEEFLKTKGKDQAEQLATAAAETGFTVMAFRHWVAGRSIPRKETMAKLQEWSGGSVTPADFFTSAPPAPEKGHEAA
jgi:hypothetical protein